MLGLPDSCDRSSAPFIACRFGQPVTYGPELSTLYRFVEQIRQTGEDKMRHLPHNLP